MKSKIYSCVKNRKYKASSLRISSAPIKMRKFSECVSTAYRILNARKG